MTPGKELEEIGDVFQKWYQSASVTLETQWTQSEALRRQASTIAYKHLIDVAVFASLEFSLGISHPVTFFSSAD